MEDDDMDDEPFDALVKRLAQTRLSRLDALRGLAASALAGVVGVTLPEAEGEAKPHHKRKGQSHGKGKAKDRKGKGKHAHPKAQPVVCPNGRCDTQPSKCRTADTGCVCLGTGPQSRCGLPTTTTAAPITTSTTTTSTTTSTTTTTT